jgi:1A family penicillin-binding protein
VRRAARGQRRRLVVAGGGALLLGAVLLAAWLARLDARVQRYLAGPPIGTTRIMAAPKVLPTGAPVGRERLLTVLGRLGYVVTQGGSPAAGEVTPTADGLDLRQRPSTVPWPSPRYHARITIADGQVRRIVDVATGNSIRRLEFEPEPLAVGGERSALEATAEPVPPHCRDAVLAAEDRYFYHHPGVNPVAIARALVTNLRSGGVRQGGSTLTQQLAKNAFLSPQRTYVRKLREAALAVLLELRTTKEEILRRYLASVYLGTDGGVPVHGLAQAALVHLGKPLRTLDTADCALLAGMIQSPNKLAPRRHPEAARARRDQVLALMADAGFLTPDETRAALASSVAPAPARARPVGALYVADRVRHELETLLPHDVATSPGLTVYTSVDLDTQHDAEEVVQQGLARLERAHARLAAGSLQAALLALDPSSGRIRALVGGRDYRSSQLDRVARMRRQPGSTFKPFVYLTALDPERSQTVGLRTVASLVEDAPFRMQVGPKLWTPVNWDGQYHGSVTLADALAGSMNTATVRLALTVGLDSVIRTAKDFGIAKSFPRVPAIALGSVETSLLDLTTAYGAIADGGLLHPARAVVAVSGPDGALLYADDVVPRRVTSPDVAYLVTDLLRGVIDRGTGHAVRSRIRGPVAGKTGTTNGTRDAWFVGFTPDLVAGVWVGRDDGARIGLGGSRAALPIWSAFMERVARRWVSRDFPVPPGIVWATIDPSSGELATPQCPEQRRMPFLRATEPRRFCTLHGAQMADARGSSRPFDRSPSWAPRGGFGGWLRALFR